MLKTVDDVITGVIQREGSQYTNRPSDKGGPTRWGITLATLSAYRGHGCTASDVQALGEAEARQIYRNRFVIEPNFTLVLDVQVDIGIELIDTGVNMGPEVAARFFQRALNVFNGRGTYYQDIKADGVIGPVSASALRSYMAKRGAEGVTVMLKALNALQAARYVELAELRIENEDYVYGWIKERA